VISLAVAVAGWVGSSHPEIAPTSNFHHLRDTTNKTMNGPLNWTMGEAGNRIAGEQYFNF